MTIRSETGPADGPGRVRATTDARRLCLASARGFGIVFTVSAMLNLVVPALGRLQSFVPVLLGLVVLLAGFVVLGRHRHGFAGVAVTYFVGLATLGAFLLPGAGVIDGSTLATVTMVASLAIPSLVVAVADRQVPPALIIAAGIPVLLVAVVVTAPFGRAVFVAIAVLGGWLAMALAGLWLTRSAARVEEGADRLRQGYDAERRSTEAEAERRHGARVLHDTVLATLSVIAHAGAGVPPATLRAQAAADSALLARLRTDGTVVPPSAGAGSAPATRARDLRRLVEAGFAGRGFTVVWHGVSEVEASVTRLDALARALSECLENARRHSGAPGAEVTVSHDDRAVRAVVTDTGVGFDRAAVPRGRLGLTESVEERMRAVGGSARIFSSVGRGTTVLLEVPR